MIPFFVKDTEYFHCFDKDGYKCLDNTNETIDCILGNFVSIISPINGNSYGKNLEIEAKFDSVGWYDISFWIYFYCPRACENNNDRVTVTMLNRNRRIIAILYKYTLNNESNELQWIQKKIKFYNNAQQDLKVHFILIFQFFSESLNI